MTGSETKRDKLAITIASLSIFLIVAGITGIFFLYPYLTRNEVKNSLQSGQNLIAVTLEGIKMDTQTNMPVILLKEKEGNRYLPIWIGAPEAIAISLELSGTKTPRPMTHDLIVNIFETLGITVDSAIITSVKENTFYATLKLKDKNGNLIEIDSRPSDAVAIAVRVHCQILVSKDVLESNGIEVKPVEKKFKSLNL